MNIKELASEVFIAESTGNNLILFDIDDTLLIAQGIKIYRKLPTDKQEVVLTPEQFAKENITAETKDAYDYRDFRDEKKVSQSIKTGLPIISNLAIMDSYIKNGWKVGLLTARGMEDIISSSMKSWLKYKVKGELKSIGDKLVRKLVFAINDENKRYSGETVFEKKAAVIKKLAKEYDRIVFVDDDESNIEAVKEMAEKYNLKNVIAKQAKK